MISRPLRVLLLAGAAMPLAVLGVGSAAAQDDSSTTSTTQLVLNGSVVAPAGGADGQPPTRVDAGAGGSAAGSELPIAGVALAGGLVIVTGAGALKLRREQQR